MQNIIMLIPPRYGVVFWINYDLEAEGKVRAQNIPIHIISQLGFNDKVSRSTLPLMRSVIYSENDI